MIFLNLRRRKTDVAKWIRKKSQYRSDRELSTIDNEVFVQKKKQGKKHWQTLRKNSSRKPANLASSSSSFSSTQSPWVVPIGRFSFLDGKQSLLYEREMRAPAIIHFSELSSSSFLFPPRVYRVLQWTCYWQQTFFATSPFLPYLSAIDKWENVNKQEQFHCKTLL